METFLREVEFRLPASMRHDRSRSNNDKKDAGTKYKEDVANARGSRLVAQYSLEPRARGFIEVAQRYTEQDDIPRGKAVGDEMRVRRTQKHPGRRQTILNEKLAKLIRQETAESQITTPEPETTEADQEISLDLGKWRKTFADLDLYPPNANEEARPETTQDQKIQIEAADLLPIFNQFVRGLYNDPNYWTTGSRKRSEGLVTYFIKIDDTQKKLSNYKCWNHLPKLLSGEVALKKAQKEFLLAAYELGILTPQTQTKSPPENLKGGIGNQRHTDLPPIFSSAS